MSLQMPLSVCCDISSSLCLALLPLCLRCELMPCVSSCQGYKYCSSKEMAVVYINQETTWISHDTEGTKCKTQVGFQ